MTRPWFKFPKHPGLLTTSPALQSSLQILALLRSYPWDSRKHFFFSSKVHVDLWSGAPVAFSVNTEPLLECNKSPNLNSLDDRKYVVSTGAALSWQFLAWPLGRESHGSFENPSVQTAPQNKWIWISRGGTWMEFRFRHLRFPGWSEWGDKAENQGPSTYHLSPGGLLQQTCKLLKMWAFINRMNKEGPTVEHRELYSVSCDKPCWKRI